MADIGQAASGAILQGNGTAAPIFSTSTYPTTNAANTLLYASSANTMAALATGNYGTLTTSASGVPSISTQGSFSPGIAFGGSATGITYANQNGSYLVIGNMVFFILNITLSSKGAQTGNATITGLPLTEGQVFSLGNYIPIGNSVNLTIIGFPVFGVTSGGTTGTIYAASAGSLSAVTNTAFANNTMIEFQGFYTLN